MSTIFFFFLRSHLLVKPHLSLQLWRWAEPPAHNCSAFQQIAHYLLNNSLLWSVDSHHTALGSQVCARNSQKLHTQKKNTQTKKCPSQVRILKKKKKTSIGTINGATCILRRHCTGKSEFQIACILCSSTFSHKNMGTTELYRKRWCVISRKRQRRSPTKHQ